MAKEKKEKFDFIQPFKDLPQALKGFPKNLIHAWKDPVNNSEEVKERRKEIYPLLYLFVIVFLLLAILGAVITDLSDIMMIIGLVPGFGAAACVFLLFVLKKAAQKFADLECDNCKKRIDFDENVRIKVIDKKFSISKEDKTIKKNDIPVESTIKVIGKERVTIEITCKCQACGTEKTFTHEFVSMECNKTAVRIPYVQSGAMLVQFEADVRAAYNSGACNVDEIHPTNAEISAGGKTGSSITTENGVNITYKRSPASLVKGYFGNELQMR
jgi:hypothetical protein